MKQLSSPETTRAMMLGTADCRCGQGFFIQNPHIEPRIIYSPPSCTQIAIQSRMQLSVTPMGTKVTSIPQQDMPGPLVLKDDCFD